MTADGTAGGENPVTATSHGPPHRRGDGRGGRRRRNGRRAGPRGLRDPVHLDEGGRRGALAAGRERRDRHRESGRPRTQYELYFFRDHKLTPVVRYTNQPVTQELIIAELIKGPDSTDTADGYTSAIPGEPLDRLVHRARPAVELPVLAAAEPGGQGRDRLLDPGGLNAPAVGTWTADRRPVLEHLLATSPTTSAPPRTCRTWTRPRRRPPASAGNTPRAAELSGSPPGQRSDGQGRFA